MTQLWCEHTATMEVNLGYRCTVIPESRPVGDSRSFNGSFNGGNLNTRGPRFRKRTRPSHSPSVFLNEIITLSSRTTTYCRNDDEFSFAPNYPFPITTNITCVSVQSLFCTVTGPLRAINRIRRWGILFPGVLIPSQLKIQDTDRTVSRA